METCTIQEYKVYKVSNSIVKKQPSNTRNFYTCKISHDPKIINKTIVTKFLKSIVCDNTKILKIKELLSKNIDINGIVDIKNTSVFYIWVYMNNKLSTFDLFFYPIHLEKKILDIIKESKYHVYTRKLYEKIEPLLFKVELT
jgi:hypothetical protein